MKTTSLILAAICLFSLAISAGAAGRIIVTGEGSVETAPDMATISLGVTTEAKDAAEAMSTNSEATASVLERVAAAGVEPRDVQTSGLSLSPNWANDQSTGTNSIVGFVANNQVTVRVRDLKALGGILDDVVRNGANTFNGLTFGLQNPDPVMDEARKEAVAEALRKAKLYAEAAGVTLGPIAELTERTGGGPEPMYARGARMEAAAVPVAEGEVSIAAQVTVEFEIAE